MLDSSTLRGLSITYLQDDFDNPVESPAFHEEMWDYCCSDHKLVAIAAPRNHAKTSAITGTYVIGSVVFREHDFIVIVSDTEGQAKLFLGDARKQLIENEALMSAFGIDPVKPLEMDSKTDIILNFIDGHQARIMAKGSGQKGRGVKWKNKRPNLIIIDDAENEELVANPLRRRDFRRWLRNSLVQSLSKYGKVRMVGTILHSDSALENYMPEGQTPKQYREEHVVYDLNKTYSTYVGPEMVWYGARYKAHPGIDDYSSLLWPQAYNEEWYRTKYYEFLADGDAEGYAQEYLNQPTDESQAFFRAPDLLPMTELDWGKPKTWYCGVDFAISEKNYRDFTTFATQGMDDSGVLHLTEMFRSRVDTFGIVQQFFVVHQLHKDVIFLVEKGAIWEAVKPVLFKTMAQKQKFPIIKEVGSIEDKRAKAGPFQARTRAKAYRFDKESLWWPDCEAELKAFPRGKFDDQVDGIGIVPRRLHELAEGEEYEDPEDNYAEDEYDEYEESEYEPMGQSSVTGY